MTELGPIFVELGISHYLKDFVEQGFDTWETILDITESDFDALGVKLGHRRKLQRKIAESRGLSSDQALASPRATPTDDRSSDEKRATGVKSENKDGTSRVAGAKRKYRRHPKPDESAPERPPSAYVIFSNKMREELKGRSLSFTEIAKLVGENWQNLSPGDKEPYEQHAFAAKDRYNSELAQYKKTEQYSIYCQYLIEFKARYANTQQATQSEAVKRPKLQATLSAGSSGASGTESNPNSDTSTLRPHFEQETASTVQWRQIDSLSASQAGTIPNVTAVPPITSFHGPAILPTVLPGYRDAIHSALPWRENQRDETQNKNQQQLPRIASLQNAHEGSSASAMESVKNFGMQQHAQRLGHSHPSPLLTSESTNLSTASSGSTRSSYFSPRTPMEPPFDRGLPIPPLYTPKTSGDTFLPPIRPPSLSPQTTALGSQQSPVGSHTGDYPNSILSLRGYATVPSHQLPPSDSPVYRGRDYPPSSSTDDTILDPVSALLRAGEIVDQNSRG